jgi:lipoprotein signal peptidase
MPVTTAKLTRWTGLSAVAAGLLFIGVQINHPPLDAEFATTTEYTVRQSLKVLMSGLSLIGITGMYLRQVKQAGRLGLLGYLVFGAGYLIMTSVEVIGAVVLPTIARSDPGYVNDVFAVVLGEQVNGDIGLFPVLNIASALTFLGGGLLFGIALFRAKVLARWAAALLAIGSVATLAIPLLPQVSERLFAIPTGVALVGLGYSLWSGLRTPAAHPLSGTAGAAVAPEAVK